MITRSGLIGCAVLLVALVVGVVLMMDSVVRQMLYPAPPVRVPAPPPAPLVEVPLEAGGRAVWAWYRPAATSSDDAARRGGAIAPIVLMLHGNGENLETMRQAGLFEDLGRTGAAVLAIDYPGYGRSPGTPSEAANLAAADAAWEWVLRHRDGRPPLIAGWSLGAAVAAELAAKRRDDAMGVILLSAWDRLDAVARLHFPGWMVGALLSERYDSAAAAAHIAAPALVVHGDRDDIIPIDLGRRLYSALPGPKQWVEVPGASHNDLLARPETWQAIHTFLDARSERPGG